MSQLRKYKKGVRVALTKNFNSTEFDCKCSLPSCQWTIIDLDHVNWLQKKREEWKKPINITSAFRCAAHNKTVGGSTKSRHVEGDATDIQVLGWTPEEVASRCEDANGLGRYNTFTHVDSRPLGNKTKARWDFRKK